MQVISEVIILNLSSKEKKDKTGNYYMLDFLDNEDISYKNFISKELFEKLVKANIKRFDKANITINIGKSRTGTGFDIFVSDVNRIVFDDKTEGKSK